MKKPTTNCENKAEKTYIIRSNNIYVKYVLIIRKVI